MEPTLQEIEATQGTRLRQDVNPWDTYASSLQEKLNPKLELEIEEYAKHRHQKSSSQNEEEYHKQREFNECIAKQYQWLHPSEYADAGPRIGRKKRQPGATIPSAIRPVERHAQFG